MAYPAYVREKARQLRIEKHLSIDEIAKRLALPKTTIYYWVKDLPLGRPRRANPGQRKGNQGMCAKYRMRRAAAYAQGRLDFARFVRDPTFRDFVCLYMAEGYKRSRNTVAVCNSDPAIVLLCASWVRHFREIRSGTPFSTTQTKTSMSCSNSGQLSCLCHRMRSGSSASRIAVG